MAILNEHLFTLRLREAGTPVVDVTWLAGMLERVDVDAIDWKTGIKIRSMLDQPEPEGHPTSPNDRGRRPASVVVIDQANQDFVSGWAFHESGVDRVDVFMDGRRAGTASYGLYRADVAERHQDRGLPIPGSATRSTPETWLSPQAPS